MQAEPEHGRRNGWSLSAYVKRREQPTWKQNNGDGMGGREGRGKREGGVRVAEKSKREHHQPSHHRRTGGKISVGNQRPIPSHRINIGTWLVLPACCGCDLGYGSWVLTEAWSERVRPVPKIDERENGALLGSSERQ